MRSLISKLAVLFVVLFVVVPTTTSVLAAELRVAPMLSLYGSENLKSGRGLKLSIDWDSPIWCGFTYEKTLLRFGGQEMADLDIFGIIIGVKKKDWFAEFGYYMPTPEYRASYKEGLWLEINRVLQPSCLPATYDNNSFSYGIKNNFGISAGREFEYQLTDSLSFQSSITYRWLKFEDVIMCHFPTGSHWEVFSHRDFSGVLGNVGLTYRW